MLPVAVSRTNCVRDIASVPPLARMRPCWPPSNARPATLPPCGHLQRDADRGAALVHRLQGRAGGQREAVVDGDVRQALVGRGVAAVLQPGRAARADHRERLADGPVRRCCRPGVAVAAARRIDPGLDHGGADGDHDRGARRRIAGGVDRTRGVADGADIAGAERLPGLLERRRRGPRRPWSCRGRTRPWRCRWRGRWRSPSASRPAPPARPCSTRRGSPPAASCRRVRPRARRRAGRPRRCCCRARRRPRRRRRWRRRRSARSRSSLHTAARSARRACARLALALAPEVEVDLGDALVVARGDAQAVACRRW